MQERYSEETSSIISQLPFEEIFANTEKRLEESEKSFRSFEDELRSDPELALKCLGRFGFRNSGDVINFFNSTEGRVAANLIAEELHRQKKQEENLRDAIQHMEREKQFRIGLLLLGLMYKQERYEHIENALEEEREAKAREEARHKETTDSAKNTTQEKITAQEKALEAVKSIKQEKKIGLHELEEKISKIDKRIDDLEQQRAQCVADIQDIRDEYAHAVTVMDNPDAPTRANYVRLLDSSIKSMKSTAAIAYAEAASPITPKYIDEKIATPEEAQKGLSRLESKITALMELRDLVNGTTIPVNANGDVCSISEAHSYLTKAGETKPLTAARLSANKEAIEAKIAEAEEERVKCKGSLEICREEISELEAREESLMASIKALRLQSAPPSQSHTRKEDAGFGLEPPSSDNDIKECTPNNHSM